MNHDAIYRIEKLVDTGNHEEVGKLRELPGSAQPAPPPPDVERSEVIEPWEIAIDPGGTQRTTTGSDETISEMLVLQGVEEADAEARRLSDGEVSARRQPRPNGK